MAKKTAKKTTSKPAAKTSPAEGPQTFQSFDLIVIPRSKLRKFAGNPRTIDKHALRKLRESVRKNGLVEPIVVNKRTNLTILGGHQRIEAMDQLSEYPKNDYNVPCAVLDITPGKEKALVISLNNEALQGNWEAESLANLFMEIKDEPGGNLTDTGFDRMELELMSGFSPEFLGNLFDDPVHQPDSEILDAADEIISDGKEADKQRKADAEELEAVKGEQEEVYEDLDGLKERREKHFAKRIDNESEFAAVIVFNSLENRRKFMRHYDLEPDARYYSGEQFAGALGLELEP